MKYLRPVLIALLPILAVAGLGWHWVGKGISQAAASRVGAQLVAAGKGKVSDPATFLFHRGSELIFLLAIAILLTLALTEVHRLLQKRASYREVSGVGAGLLVFVGLNLWILAGTQTALFWLPFFNGLYVDNIVQYQIKKHLLAEHPAAKHAVLLGNSQTRASIDEEVLNVLLAPRLWTTELHQPGGNGFDTSLVVDDLRGQPFDLAILYVSEIFIYAHENGAVAPRFLQLRHLPFLHTTDGWRELGPAMLREGIAGALCPILRLNASFSQRLLGGFTAELPGPSLPVPISPRRSPLQIDAGAEFQKRGLERALAELVEQGKSVLLIAGGVNPAARANEDPAVRTDLARWLESLAVRWPQAVRILPETAFFQATPQDYADHAHLTKEAQARFTRALAGYLP